MNKCKHKWVFAKEINVVKRIKKEYKTVVLVPVQGVLFYCEKCCETKIKEVK